MPSQFDNQDLPSLSALLRSQRMTADEAKAVIVLWQQQRFEETGLTDRPAVPDVAEGLDLGVEDVQRLLAEVRERRVEEERGLAYEQELAEIRLAEEERKLAEIQQQRAELRREQVRGQKPPAAAHVLEKPSDLTWQIPVGILVVFIVLWMAISIMNSLTGSNAPGSSGCVLTTPDGVSQPCGPVYEQAHPDQK